MRLACWPWESLSHGTNRPSACRRVLPKTRASPFPEKEKMLTAVCSCLALYTGLVPPALLYHTVQPSRQLPRNRYDRYPCCLVRRVCPIHPLVELHKLRILPDRRPGRLDHQTPQHRVSRLSYASSIRPVSCRVLGLHKPQKTCCLV